MPKAKRRSSGKGRKPTRPCTYELGYVRQDLYTCNKCTRQAKGQLSGFCRGCREACHADHAEHVVELYTKRDFRCDCGNGRAKNVCVLMPDKDDLNVGNERTYSHNFEGRYCRCDREYDPNLPMAQCAMCEDWFHEDCYKTDAKARGRKEDRGEISVEYEFTCKDCVKLLPLLAEYYEKFHAWSGARIPRVGKKTQCIRPKGVDIALKPGAIDFIWRPNFRLALCRCNDCMAIYEKARVGYLVDPNDFVGAPMQEDTDLLNATDDAEILKDVLEEKEPEKRKEKREKVLGDDERIPRKPLPPAVKPDGRLTQEEMQMVRNRIREFLHHSIQTNGGNINPDSLRAYLCDLKLDLLNSLPDEGKP